MAKSFADDNAFGAGGPGMSTAPGADASASGASSTPSASVNPAAASGALNYAGGGGGGGGLALPSASSGGGGAAPSGGIPTSPSGFPSPQLAPMSGGQGSNVPQPAGGIFFDEGGSVPDDNGASQQQDPMSAILQRSLGSVDQTLQQLYKQYGLSTGDQNQTGGVQEAAAMPVRPGGQSETGIPPQRPGPGTLPPTSNPFGKRADAGQQGGIQDTDGDNDQETA